jgi:hypothetical protein
MTEQACLICEVETITRRREEELRRTVRPMNPATEPNYELMFNRLIYENQTLRLLRGELRAPNRKNRKTKS